MEQGIVLAGGGALLHGLAQRLQHETGMPIVIADNPLHCVAIGSGQSLEEFEALKGVLFSSASSTSRRPAAPRGALPAHRPLPRSRLLFLVLTSITLLTLDFRGDGGGIDGRCGTAPRAIGAGAGRRPTPCAARSATPGTASPATTTSRPRTPACGPSSTSSTATRVGAATPRRAYQELLGLLEPRRHSVDIPTGRRPGGVGAAVELRADHRDRPGHATTAWPRACPWWPGRAWSGRWCRSSRQPVRRCGCSPTRVHGGRAPAAVGRGRHRRRGRAGARPCRSTRRRRPAGGQGRVGGHQRAGGQRLPARHPGGRGSPPASAARATSQQRGARSTPAGRPRAAVRFVKVPCKWPAVTWRPASRRGRPPAAGAARSWSLLHTAVLPAAAACSAPPPTCCCCSPWPPGSPAGPSGAPSSASCCGLLADLFVQTPFGLVRPRLLPGRLRRRVVQPARCGAAWWSRCSTAVVASGARRSLLYAVLGRSSARRASSSEPAPGDRRRPVVRPARRRAARPVGRCAGVRWALDVELLSPPIGSA